jgi:hypothetical protein
MTKLELKDILPNHSYIANCLMKKEVVEIYYLFKWQKKILNYL